MLSPNLAALNQCVLLFAGCTVSGRQVSCNLGSLAAGATQTVTVNVKATTAGTYGNVATVSSPDDVNPANDEDAANAFVVSTLCLAAGARGSTIAAPAIPPAHTCMCLRPLAVRAHVRIVQRRRPVPLPCRHRLQRHAGAKAATICLLSRGASRCSNALSFCSTTSRTHCLCCCFPCRRPTCSPVQQTAASQTPRRPAPALGWSSSARRKLSLSASSLPTASASHPTARPQLPQSRSRTRCLRP